VGARIGVLPARARLLELPGKQKEVEGIFHAPSWCTKRTLLPRLHQNYALRRTSRKGTFDGNEGTQEPDRGGKYASLRLF
jgi:hypothetical protein